MSEEVSRPIRIHVSRGCTVNTGDYNSQKMDVGIGMDVDSSAEIEEAYKELRKIVELKIEEFREDLSW